MIIKKQDYIKNNKGETNHCLNCIYLERDSFYYTCSIGEFQPPIRVDQPKINMFFLVSCPSAILRKPSTKFQLFIDND